MSLKLKAFGLGLLAMMAMGAFAVMNASADTGGHFTWNPAGNPDVSITGTENAGTHRTELQVPGLTGIVCNHALYEGTAVENAAGSQTATSLTVTPTYSSCLTTGGTAGETVVDMNSCHYEFTIGDDVTKKHTVHIRCPGATKFIAVTHQGCEIRVPAQTVGGTATSGVEYTTTTEEVNKKIVHTITLDANVIGFTTHFEAGFCVLLGTTKTSDLKGSVPITGFEDLGNDATHPHGIEGNVIGITATTSAL